MKTAEEILESMRQEMPFHLPERIRPYIKEAMQIYASQALDKAAEVAKVKEVTANPNSKEISSEVYKLKTDTMPGSGAKTLFVDHHSILSVKEELK